jgi:hypothetical protein
MSINKRTTSATTTSSSSPSSSSTEAWRLPLPTIKKPSAERREQGWDRYKWCVWCDRNLAGSTWGPQFEPEAHCRSCRGYYCFAVHPTFPEFDPSFCQQLAARLEAKEKESNQLSIYYNKHLLPLLLNTLEKAEKLAAIPDFNERRKHCLQEASGLLTTMFYTMREHQRMVLGCGVSLPFSLQAIDLFDLYKKAKMNIQYSIYQHIHPELLTFDEKWLGEEFAQAVRIVKGESQGEVDDEKRKQVRQHFKRECDNVLSICLLSREYCTLLIDEMRNLKSKIEYASLDYMGLYLDKLGYQSFMEEFANLLNLVSRCFNRYATLHFKAVSVIYFVGTQHSEIPTTLLPQKPGKYMARLIFHRKFDQYNVRAAHPPHSDKTDLTVNICLGDEFTGGALRFALPVTRMIDPSQAEGQVLDPSGDNVEVCTCRQIPQRALIHPGELAHASKPVKTGERFNLVLWFDASFRFEKFIELPAELQLHTFSFLSLKDLCNVALTNRHFHQLLATHSTLWKELYINTFERPLKAIGSTTPTPTYNPGPTPFAHYVGPAYPIYPSVPPVAMPTPPFVGFGRLSPVKAFSSATPITREDKPVVAPSSSSSSSGSSSESSSSSSASLKSGETWRKKYVDAWKAKKAEREEWRNQLDRRMMVKVARLDHQPSVPSGASFVSVFDAEYRRNGSTGKCFVQ